MVTKFKILGAAFLSIALATSPAMARGFGGGHGGGVRAGGGPGHFAAVQRGGAGFATGGVRYGGGNYRGGGIRRGGFGPGIAAGVIAGAALGAYGYSNGYVDPGYYDDSYAYDAGPTVYVAPNVGYNPNGFVCQPGTVFVGEDGRRHLCQ